MALGSVGSMVVSVLADTRDFDKKMGTSTKKVDKFQAGVQKMGKAITKAAKLAAAAAAAAVVAFGVSAVKTFVDFDTGMREVFTLMPELSAEAREAMEEDIQALSEEIGVLPTEIIPALYQAISAGVPRENVFEYMRVAGEAAVGGNIELKDSVVGLAQVMNAYGAEVNLVRDYSDIMFSIVKDGITTMGELSSELFKVAPVAADLGIAFSSIAGWMAELTAQGVPTAEAASYMKVALNELSKAGTVASDTFEKAAGITFPKFIEAGGTLVEAFEIIDDYAIDADMSVKDMFGSIEAGGAVLMATGVHFDSFSGKVANAEEASGNTAAAYAEMAAGIKHEIDNLKVWWQNLQLDIGGDLTENLKDLLGWLEDNREAIGDGIKAVFAALIDGLKWLQANAESVKTALIAVSVGLGAIVLASAGLPQLVVALAALIALMDDVPSGFSEEFEDLAKVFDPKNSESITSYVYDYSAALLAAMSKMEIFKDGAGVAFNAVYADVRHLQDEVLAMTGSPEELADAWILGIDIILSKYAEMGGGLEVLEALRIGFIDTTGAAVNAVTAAETAAATSTVLTAQMMAGAWGVIADAAGDTADKVATELVRLTDEQLAFYKEALVRAAELAVAATELATAIEIENTNIAESYEETWASAKQATKDALGDMLNEIAEFRWTRLSEEETHEEALAAIRTEYAGQSEKDLAAALKVEQDAYDDSKTKIKDILVQSLIDLMGALRQELLLKAAAHLVDAIALAFIPGMQGVAAGHLAASGTYGVLGGGLALAGFAEGGVVPGPEGVAQMAVVHGGEEVLTPEQRGAMSIDYERMGEAVAAGNIDAMTEMGSGGPSGSSADLRTKLAQLLYDPLETERERRGGTV